jgi:hypothetical protein
MKRFTTYIYTIFNKISVSTYSFRGFDNKNTDKLLLSEPPTILDGNKTKAIKVKTGTTVSGLGTSHFSSDFAKITTYLKNQRVNVNQLQENAVSISTV